MIGRKKENFAPHTKRSFEILRYLVLASLMTTLDKTMLLKIEIWRTQYKIYMEHYIAKIVKNRFFLVSKNMGINKTRIKFKNSQKAQNMIEFKNTKSATNEIFYFRLRLKKRSACVLIHYAWLVQLSRSLSSCKKNEEKKINKPCSKNTKTNLKSAERTVKSVVTQNDAEFGH